MIGHTKGHVTSQGYVLSELFASEGYKTLAISKLLNRYARLADISATLIRHRKDIEIALIEVYSGPAFVVADVASFVSRRLGYKTILTLHGGNLPAFLQRFPNWTRRVLDRAHALVAPSEYLAQAVGLNGRAASIISNVIDLEAYPYRCRTRLVPRLFWMRSFHHLYNPALALKVAAGLRSEYSDVSLVMAGQDKGLQAKMQDLASTLGVGDAVRFPGFLNKTSKALEGARADIYLNSSHIDNAPVAILEASAMGLPVVATHVGGVACLLQDGENGLLVPDDDVPAMISAIRRLLHEPRLAARLSANGRNLAERSSWQKVRPLWEALLGEILG